MSVCGLKCLGISFRAYTLVTNDAGCVKSWSLNPYPSRFDSMRRQKLPGDKWCWWQGMEKRDKKNSSSISEVFGKVTLDESCFCGLCHCPVWIVLYSLVPTSLPQLCLLHHCFTHMLSEVPEIIRTSIFSFLVENWMLKLVFLVALVRRWLA